MNFVSNNHRLGPVAVTGSIFSFFRVYLSMDGLLLRPYIWQSSELLLAFKLNMQSVDLSVVLLLY